MKTQTAIPEVLYYPALSVNTIDIRIDKKEFEILTEDGSCIIDEVEFVKIIDLNNEMPLPVVAAPQPTTAANTRKGIHKFASRILNRLSLLPFTFSICLVLVMGEWNVLGQTYYNMSSADYSQNFNGITTLPTNFSTVAISSTGSIPIATNTTTASTSALSVVASSTAIGIDASTSTRLVFLSSGATNNTTAIATDLNLNFTSRNAGNLGFDVSTIFNSTGNRVGTLRIYYSTDGSTWSELTGTNLPYSATNNVAGSASVSINLPSAINNQANVKFRFYYHNGTGGSSGSRPRIGIDNLSVTSTAAATAPAAPTISSITPGNQQLSVAFTAGSDGGSAITNYKYSTDGGTSWQTRASGTTASPLLISTLSTDGTTALTNGTSYNIQIRAVNAVGDGTATASTAATPRTTPSAPTITSITPGNQQLSVAYTAGSDGGSAITTYKYSTNGGVNWQTRSAGTTASPLVISTLSTDGTTALTNGVSYDIQIRAVNAAGDGTASSTTSATPVAPVSPTLNAVTLSSSLTSTYGTASTGVSFTANGSNLTAENITATAQSGYEVSTSLGSGYGASVSVAAGTTVYVRFASTISAGDKNSATAVVLSGGGATSSADVTTSSSGNTVSQKVLTVTGLTAQNKVYDGLNTATATGTAALSGVVGADVVSLSGTPTFTFSSANVGTGISVTTSGYSLTGGDAVNYTLTQPTLSANITVRSLTITANNVSKVQGVLLTGGAGSTAFTSSGLQNSETIGSVTITYGSAGATTGDGNTVGVYASQVTPSAATGGTFSASNYSISYVAGSITVTAAPCLSENFETNSLTNWNNAGGTTGGGTTAVNGTSGDYYLNLNENGEWAQLPSSQTYNTITFNLKGSASTNSWTLKVQTSSDGTTWNDEGGSGTIAGSSIGTSYSLQTVTLSTITNFVRLFLVRTSNSCYVGNIDAFCTLVPEINVKQSSTNLASGSGSYSFGTQTVGNTSSAVTFTIENTGTATLNLTGSPKVAISGHTSDFTINQTSTSATVAASGNTTFTVSFSPTTTGARSATISIANDDSNENPYTFSVTGTGATYAPSVTSSAATSIATTGATLNGEVTSDEGSAITERGFVYKTSSGVTISDNKTTVAGTTGVFSLSPSSLSVNTRYYFRAYATNSVNTTLGSELDFWTLANVPTAPTVNTPTGSTLNVTIGGADGNPATTTYAIQETTSGNYVQANGSLGASAVWQTASTWSAITVIGLSSATTYTFQVKARNGANTETAFGPTANGTTSSIGLNAVILSSALTSTYGSVSSGVSFTASGSNLTSNITATAQSGYQVSTDNSSFGPSVSVASGTTVYVRFTSTLSAGNYNNQVAVVLSGGGASSDANVTTSLSGNTVSPKALSITTATIASKVYDGSTTSGTVTAGTLSGFVGSETVVVASATGTYADANGGTGKTATISYTLGNGTNGGLAANYSLANTTATGDITQATQTITFTSFTTPITSSTTIVASSNFGGAITYSSSNTNVATINSSTGVVTIVGNGTTTITASNAGNSNYTSASTSQMLTVNPTTSALVTFDFAGIAGSESTSNSNATSNGIATSIISRGSGLTTSANADRFNASNWATGSIANAVSGNNYMEFTVTPNSGFQFTVSSIQFQIQRSGTGLTALALRSSVDNYASNLDAEKSVSDITTTQSFTFTFSQANSTNAVTYRLYGYAESTSGSGGPGDGTGNDIIVNGIVSCLTPSQSSAISGSTTICSDVAETYSVTNVSGVGYTWSLPVGWSGTSTTNSINATVGSSAGTISITPYNAASGCSNYTANSQSISVTVNATPSAPTASAQSFCSSASPTVADLTVTSGSSIKWYDAASNGNLLAGGTALAAGNYYASQTVSGCESSRTSVVVTINANGTWVGGSTGDWNTAENWCGGVPDISSESASIPSGVTVTVDASPTILTYTLASGSTVNLGNNTITIANGGSFTNNGTFNSQTGTVAFAGTGTLAGNSTTFNNLTVNGALTINTSPTVNGTVTINNGGSVTTNPILYGVSGSLVYNVNSSITSTHHEWPATSSPYNVTIQNNSVVTLNDDKVVNGTLTLTSGKLTLGNKSLTITGSINGGSTNCFINTNTTNTNNNNQGALIRSVNTTGVTYSFPIGRDAVYSPLSLTFNPGTSFNNTTISATTHNSKVSNLNSSHTHYLERHWIVEPNTTISNLNYDISLTVNPSEVAGSGDFSDLRPVKYSGGSWYRPTGTNFLDGIEQGTSSSPIGNTLTWQGLSTFSEFGGVGDGAMPLPVELLSFNASCVEDQNILSWQTASEHNTSHFDIEKSRDGQTWNVIGQQTAAGNSTELLSYQFVDLEKNNSTVYYRLNQVDIDGKNEYFGPDALDCEQNNFEASTLPNPSSGNFWIKIQSNESSLAELKLVDVKGNVLFTNDITIQEGINDYPVSHLLDSGMYFIHIQNTKDQKIKVLKHLQN